MVRKDLLTSGAVKSPQDLKGRTISLGNGRGQYSYMLVNTILERNNLSWSDIKVQNLAFADTMIAMNNKIIDAGFMIEPLLSAAVEKNIAGVFISGGEVEVGAHLSILLYSAEFSKQTDLATRFMVAYLQGVRDYTDAFIHHKNQDAAIELLVKVLSVKDPNVWKNAMPQNIYADGKVNIDDIRRQAGVYKKMGDVSGPVPPIEKYVDTHFAEAATKILSAK
jgi:NitT/TauT family transport system substrate-binding protein